MDTISRKTKNEALKWSIDIICVVIYLTSVVIRLLKLILEPLLLRDCAFYLGIAEIWNKTGDYHELLNGQQIIPPLPLFCIKTLLSFCGDSEISGRSLALFLGGLIPVAGFLLTREISHNIRISIVAAVCFIIHPHFVFYSTQPLRENYYLLLIGLLLIAMVRNFRSPITRRWFVCGTIVGAAFFCRYESLEFVVVIVVEMVFLKLTNPKTVPFLKSICCFFLAFVLSLLLLLSCTGFDFSFIDRINTYNRMVYTLPFEDI